MRIDRPRCVVAPVAPDLGDDVAPCEHAVGVRHQELQQRELADDATGAFVDGNQGVTTLRTMTRRDNRRAIPGVLRPRFHKRIWNGVG